MNRLLLTAMLAAGAAGVVDAQTAIIPATVNATTEGNSSTGYPWDRDTTTPASNDIRVLYVYDSGNVSAPGPIIINQLRFRANATASSWTGVTYTNVEVRMGEAGIDYTALASGQTWDSAYLSGTAPAPAFAGPVVLQPGTGNGTGVPGPWYVTIPLSTPVLYDPTSGNDLVLDIKHDGVISTGGGGAFASDSSTTTGFNTRRMYNLTDANLPTSSGVSNTGIVCELGFTPASGIFASFSVDQSEVGPGDTVTFTDTSFTSDPNGIQLQLWDFDNDGTVDATGPNPSWQVTGCGLILTSLTVFDSTNAQDTSLRNAVSVLGPAADFDWTLLTTAPPFVVQFNDRSTRNPNQWAWDFDNDGTIDSTSQNPTTVFPNRGISTVTLTATNSCGSNATSKIFDTSLKLCTQFGGIAGWNSGGGFYIDVDINNPAGLTVEALGVQIQDAGVVANINVYIKPGRHAGFETDRNAWSLVSSGTNPSSTGNSSETVIDVSDFSLAPGQWAICIEYLQSAGRFNYTTSSGTSANNNDLALSGGAMYDPAFVGNTTFSPRNWNGCVYYAIGQAGGSFAVIDDGCVGTNAAIQTMEIQGGGVPRIGQPLTLETMNGVPNAQSIISFGFTSLNGLDLGLIGMPGCRGWSSGEVSLPTPLNATGTGSIAFTPPNDQSLIGGPFWVQPITIDIGANALNITVGDAAKGTIGM